MRNCSAGIRMHQPNHEVVFAWVYARNYKGTERLQYIYMEGNLA